MNILKIIFLSLIYYHEYIKDKNIINHEKKKLTKIIKERNNSNVI